MRRQQVGLRLPFLVATTAALRVSGLENAVVRDRKPFGLLTIQPVYTVQDWTAARRLMDEYVDSARSNSDGASYCGWQWCESQDKLFISEAYNSAGTAKAHLARVAPIVERLLAGPATLDRMEVHGPSAELDALRSDLPGSAVLYAAHSGFSFFSKQTGGLRTAQTFCSIKPTFSVLD